MIMMTRIQCKMARIALGWNVKDLGKHAGIGSNTVVRFENGHRVIPATLAAMQRALEAAGVRFQEDGGIVPPKGSPDGRS